MNIAIRLEETSPPAGTLSIDDHKPQAFSGWIELLALLEQAIAPLSEPRGPRGLPSARKSAGASPSPRS